MHPPKAPTCGIDLEVFEMASISNVATNIYNYTAPVSNAGVLNDKKSNGKIDTSSVATTKLAIESTIVSIGNKKADSALTYNISGLLDSSNQLSASKSNTLTSEQAAQNAILQAQTTISDALNGLSGGSSSNTSSDIASLLNIPGVTSNRV